MVSNLTGWGLTQSYSRTQQEIQEVPANSRRQRRDSLVGQDDRAGRQVG